MLKSELLEIIQNGENSSVEFKRDDIRPEQPAKEAVGMANLQGGMILLGVEDDGTITGITRQNLEEWVMDTVFGRYVHPVIIPHYQEVLLDDDKRVTVISISAGTAKPYVLRYNDREEMYIRMGSTTRLATREQALRLFGTGGLLHTETLPVSGTSLKHLDQARIENYLRDILGEPVLPGSEDEWKERVDGLGFLTTDALGHHVCTIAGLALFGIRPRRYLRQAGLRVMVFDSDDKQYQAMLDVILDGPMVGRWNFEDGKTLIDEGIVEKLVHTIEPFITVESDKIDKSFRREKQWLYPLEAIRETVLNALAHRDWTRSVDIEMTRYNNRLEIISPGALPNSMDVEKMKAGRRTPRNPIILEVLRDYGYVDARGMGVRTKVIPLTRQFTGKEPIFEDTDDYLKTVINVGNGPKSDPGNHKTVLKDSQVRKNGPEKDPEKDKMTLKDGLQAQLVTIIRSNPMVTYDELALKTGKSRSTVKRHIHELKASGLIERIGHAKGGHWKVVNQ